MERVKKSRREIQFYSHKNKSLIIVHSQQAYNYAKRLEEDETVAGYQACVLLSPSQFDGVNPLRIRKEYFPEKDGTGVNWETDFLIEFTDGHRGVRKLRITQNLIWQASSNWKCPAGIGPHRGLLFVTRSLY
jgi:hypothetical protein